jgi:molybdopterin-binding protein
VPVLSIKQAAQILGVSDDTVRRWGEGGRLQLVRRPNGRLGVRGDEVARLAAGQAGSAELPRAAGASARNRLVGVVTRVTTDRVMAQVELQAGPFRLVSLISREAVDELGLEPGSVAIASIKSTNIVIEVPED